MQEPTRKFIRKWVIEEVGERESKKASTLKKKRPLKSFPPSERTTNLQFLLLFLQFTVQ